VAREEATGVQDVEGVVDHSLGGLEGSDFITVVDVSWNEEWNGTEQRRHFRIEGDRLFIESAPAPSIVFPGKTDFRRDSVGTREGLAAAGVGDC
jgi:Lipocalin-like domain